MVEEDSICGSTIVVGDAGGLDGHCFEEVFLVGQADELETLFDGSFKSGAISLDVTKKLREFSSFQNELAECFMTQGDLRFTYRSW